MIRVFLILLLPLVAFASDPVPAARLPYAGSWTGIVGVSGGIPNRTTVFTNFATSATAAQINNAIDLCPSNQVITFDSGTFTVNANITIDKDGVTLRGATNANGLPATIFDHTDGSSHFILERAANWWFDAGFENTLYTTLNVSAGATRGSTTITTATSPTGAAAGQLMLISATANPPGIDGDGDWSNLFGMAGGRAWGMIVRITGVSGSDISFDLPINADYLSGSDIDVHYRSADDVLKRSGVENIAFQVAGGTGFFAAYAIGGGGCDECWILNCKFTGLNPTSSMNSMIDFTLCHRLEIRRNEVSKASANGFSTYCMSLTHCTGSWVEDNIWHDIANLFPILGGNGAVFSYNFFTLEEYVSEAFLSQGVFSHGSSAHYNLFEGNWIYSHYNDGVDDGNKTHSANQTYLRERVLGWDPWPTNSLAGKDSNLHPFTFRSYHTNVSIVGCILGTTGKQTDYHRLDADTGSPFAIYNATADSTNSMIRKGNYNTVDAGINSTEALGGDTVADSYVHASKPAWFGSLTWPWVNPASPFSTATNSLAYTNFPAGYRYLYGADPPAEAGAATTSTANVGTLRVGTATWVQP